MKPVATETLPLGASPKRSPLGRRLPWFFPAFSSLLLVVLVVGFAPSFFLRGLFNIRLQSMPAYLVLHGVVLTTWYVLVAVQTWLVAAHRTNLHRRLGVVAVGVAVLLVPISAFVVVRAVPRGRALGVDANGIRGLVSGDLLALVFFSILVGLAVYYRGRPDIHKRLMMFSCLMIFGPVLERYFFFYRLPRLTGVFPFAGMVALAIYDFVSMRRVHRVTISVLIGVPIVAYLLLTVLTRIGAVDALIRHAG